MVSLNKGLLPHLPSSCTEELGGTWCPILPTHSPAGHKKRPWPTTLGQFVWSHKRNKASIAACDILNSIDGARLHGRSSGRLAAATTCTPDMTPNISCTFACWIIKYGDWFQILVLEDDLGGRPVYHGTAHACKYQAKDNLQGGRSCIEYLVHIMKRYACVEAQLILIVIMRCLKSRFVPLRANDQEWRVWCPSSSPCQPLNIKSRDRSLCIRRV